MSGINPLNPINPSEMHPMRAPSPSVASGNPPPQLSFPKTTSDHKTASLTNRAIDLTTSHEDDRLTGIDKLKQKTARFFMTQM